MRATLPSRPSLPTRTEERGCCARLNPRPLATRRIADIPRLAPAPTAADPNTWTSALPRNGPRRDDGWARKGSLMVKFGVVDEAVIAGTPQEIADAMADEALGRSSWWMPTMKMRTRDGRRPEELGAIADHWVSSKGRADRPGAVHFATRVTASAPGRVENEHIDGCFRGLAVWTSEPVDEGHTRIRMDWQTRTHGILFGLIARFMDVGSMHSSVMRTGFSAMEAHIAAVRESSQSRPQSS